MNFRFCPLISNTVIKEAISIISNQPERKEKLTFTIRGTGIKPSSFKEVIKFFYLFANLTYFLLIYIFFSILYRTYLDYVH